MEHRAGRQGRGVLDGQVGKVMGWDGWQGRGRGADRSMGRGGVKLKHCSPGFIGWSLGVDEERCGGGVGREWGRSGDKEGSR